MSSVQAALEGVKSASGGERDAKRQHAQVEEVVKKMSTDNQALFQALTGYMDAKMDRRFEEVNQAMSAMAEATDRGLGEMRKELDKVKTDIKSMGDQGAQITTHPTAPPRARSVGAKGSFKASKVYVQGFYDFKSERGALREAERDQWAQTLMAHMPAHLATEFKVEEKYKLTRRLVFHTKGVGGELCWELREKLMDAITANEYKINDKELKVRVEEEPERLEKRKLFWKAVDALRSMKTEDVDFIIEPASRSIYDQKTLERLGRVEEGGFRWNAEATTAAFPDLDVVALRRATLQNRSQ